MVAQVTKFKCLVSKLIKNTNSFFWFSLKTFISKLLWAPKNGGHYTAESGLPLHYIQGSSTQEDLFIKYIQIAAIRHINNESGTKAENKRMNSGIFWTF